MLANSHTQMASSGSRASTSGSPTPPPIPAKPAGSDAKGPVLSHSRHITDGLTTTLSEEKADCLLTAATDEKLKLSEAVGGTSPGDLMAYRLL